MGAKIILFFDIAKHYIYKKGERTSQPPHPITTNNMVLKKIQMLHLHPIQVVLLESHHLTAGNHVHLPGILPLHLDPI